MAGASVSSRRCITSAILLLAVLFHGTPAHAEAETDEAQIKAAFVYNFLKFVEWPEAALARPSDPMVIAIVGSGRIADATEQFLSTRQIGARTLVVRRVRWDGPLIGVHAVLVTENDVKKQHRILVEAASKGVLSIGDGADFANRGGVIALLIEQRRVRFDIDSEAGDAARLKISSRLLALAHRVRTAADRAGDGE